METQTVNYLALAAAYDADFNPAAPEIVIERGSGAVLVDTDGHEVIDASDIIANIGHSHPRHVAVLQQVLAQMISGKSGLTNPARARLVEILVQIAPVEDAKAYLVTNGSEAIDWAMRIARRASDKYEILTFWGGVYGRTYGTTSLNGVARRRRFGPMMPGVVHAPYPYCYRCPFNKTPDTCDFFCIDFLDEVIDHASSGEVGALIVEPYQGVGGMIFPPEGYLTRLQAWAESHDILFILDEVQSSYGRTGKMFAAEWENLTPQMVCIGKGMGGGIAIAALLAETAIFDTLETGELSGGNGGNPFASASALAVIDIMETEQLAEHAREIGDYLLERFRRWQEIFPVIGDVRGQGLALALEFVKDRATKEPYRELVQQISRYCYAHGVYISARSHILDIRPPLVITRSQAEFVADTLERALHESVQ